MAAGEITAVRYIIEFLKKRGVKTVFGYPGANILSLYDALAVSDITLVTARHEQGAIHAAAGYAKASGHVGVCIATSGPGATNLLTGIADASLDSTPLFVLTGQVSRELVGRDAFQEADILGVSMPLTKHNALVRKTDELPDALYECWEIAVSGRQGPVLIDVTRDVLEAKINASVDGYEAQGLFTLPVPEGVYEQDMAAMRGFFAHSYRPLILAGGGVIASGASDSLRRLSAKTGIPIALTMNALGVDNPGHESGGTDGCTDISPRVTLGMAGIYGTAMANAAVDRCDLLIAIGCRFSERTVGSFAAARCGKSIIHADIDKAELSKNVGADLGINADAADFIKALLALSEESSVMRDYGDWCSEIAQAAGVASEEDGSAFNALRLPDTLYVTDVGLSQTGAARRLRPNYERGFITSAGLGAMGFGLPAAVGASYAVRDFKLPVKRVLLVCGDGGFQMTMQELATMRDAPVPVKVVLFDNARLGMVEDLPHNSITDELHDADMEALRSAYELNNPDFSLIAGAYNVNFMFLRDKNSHTLLTNGENCLIISDSEAL